MFWQQVSTFKVNTEDVFKRWSKTTADLKEEIQTLQIQREEVMVVPLLGDTFKCSLYPDRTLRPSNTFNK